MKKRLAKLKLSKETVRDLSRDDQKKVDGGLSFRTNCIMTCLSDCSACISCETCETCDTTC